MTTIMAPACQGAFHTPKQSLQVPIPYARGVHQLGFASSSKRLGHREDFLEKLGIVVVVMMTFSVGDSDGQCPYCPNMVVLKVTRRFRGSGRCV
ncbi:hypothetical protein Ancab_006022 [Ancistrocladus abbreviatus]